MSRTAAPRALEFVPVDARRFELRVSGELPLGWSATVASNLTSLGCDVVIARAHLDDRRGWSGVFEGTRPLGLFSVPPSEALLLEAGATASIVPRVVSHQIVRDASTGRIDLAVRAHDASGLLATFLRQFGMLGLFPHGFDVRTEGGRADDRFALAGIGGSAASDRAERELGRLLTRWTAEPSVHRHA